MHFRLIERPGDAFQEPVTAEQVRAMCRRVLGEPARVRSATEMGWGSYNTALQVGLADGATVVLRIAPGPNGRCDPNGTGCAASTRQRPG